MNLGTGASQSAWHGGDPLSGGRFSNHQPENDQHARERRPAEREPPPTIAKIDGGQDRAVRRGSDRQIAHPDLKPYNRQPAAPDNTIQDDGDPDPRERERIAAKPDHEKSGDGL